MMTHSWILLAIAFATKERSADVNKISEVADGIIISVPSKIELQDSISWLIKNNMVDQLEDNYTLSKLGQKLIDKAQSKSKMIWKILETLEILLQEYHD